MFARAMFVAIVLAPIVSSCASKIMEGYVGKTVAHVILDYGPPSTAFDVATSQRCFNFTAAFAPDRFSRDMRASNFRFASGDLRSEGIARSLFTLVTCPDRRRVLPTPNVSLVGP